MKIVYKVKELPTWHGFRVGMKYGKNKIISIYGDEHWKKYVKNKELSPSLPGILTDKSLLPRGYWIGKEDLMQSKHWKK